MARISIEQKAFTDARFAQFGKCIGGNKWEAIARMALVWNECQERGKCVLPREVIDHIHEDIKSLTDMLVLCELAREVRHGFYIAGTKGRIEWLAKSRKNGSKGGRPKKTTGLRKKNLWGVSSNNPPSPALTLETKEERESAELLAGLASRGLPISKSKARTVARWPARYGGAAAVLARFDAASDRIFLADRPLAYFAAILGKEPDNDRPNHRNRTTTSRTPTPDDDLSIVNFDPAIHGRKN